MKKLIPSIAIVLLIMGLYLTAPSRAESSQEPQAPRTQTQRSQESIFTNELPGSNGSQIVPMVSCGVFQGTPCTGSSHPRCDLAPGEPAVCFCVNGFFECS